MTKICFIPNDMDAPGHYRCLFPARQLSEHGFDVFLPKRDETEITRKDGSIRHRVNFTIEGLPKSADIYVFQQPKNRVVSEGLLHRIRGLGMATVIDVDDDYVNVPEYNPSFVGTHPYAREDGTIINRAERRRISKQLGKTVSPNKENRQHLLDAIMKVDVVTVSTPHLKEVYAPYHKDIRVIRNCVDWDVWEDLTPQYEVERERLRIGYFGVFDYHSDDLRVIKGAVSRFMQDHPEVDFVANDEEVHSFLGVPHSQRITLGQYEFYDRVSGMYNVAEMTGQCDIGLVPLASNDLNEGKSHLKGMEYNAAGIPFIASPTESYNDYWLKKGYVGLRAVDEDDWYSNMEWLITDHALREGMGRNGRELAQRESYQQKWSEWGSLYAEIDGDDHKRRARKAIQMGAVQKVTELSPLLRLVEREKPKTIVEIGTARGGTFWAIAQTAPDDALLISLDIPSGSALDLDEKGEDVYKGRDRDRIKHFVKKTQSLRLLDLDSQAPFTRGVLMNALGEAKIDLLFIDGDHTYEGVKWDYEHYRTLVRPGGLIAFHDIVHHEDKRVGVERLWNEIKAENPGVLEFIGPETWGFKPWGGIGVLPV